MTAPGGGYNAGEAFLSIIPSFKGVVDSITREAAQWGVTAGRTFSQSFNDEVNRRTNNAPIGPSQNQSRQQGQQTGRTFADAFKARVDAALRSLPDVRVDADATPAEIKIAELRSALEDLSNKRVGVDIDAATATAEVDRIKAKLDDLAGKSPDIAVKADTLAAAAKLEEIQQQVRDLNGETANVKVDDDGSVASTSSGLGGLASALIGLAPLASPVGAALAAGLAGALETIGAVTAGIGVLALAFSAVSGAVKLLDQREQQSGTASAQAAQQRQAAAQRQISAANSIRSAEQGLADARTNADHQAITSAEQVANAQQSLADTERQVAQQRIQAAQAVASAQQNLADTERQVADQRRQAEESVQAAQYSYRQSVESVTQAEQALMDAREQARRQLESYANSAADSKLAAQQAQLDLTSAEQNYQNVLNNPNATPQQIEQAALDVAKAKQALKEANQQATQAEQDNNKAQQEGVKGSPAVKSAEQQLAAARHAQTVAAQQLADAERALNEERITGAEQVRNAQQQLANAQRAQDQQRVDGAEQVRKAQQQLADAQRQAAWQQQSSAEAITKAQQQVATAMQQAGYAAEQAGDAGSSSLAKINQQIAELPPAVRRFAEFWHSTMEPLFTSLQGTAAGAILPGVESLMRSLRSIWPEIQRFVRVTGQALGDIFAQMGRALKSPFWQQFLQFITRNIGPILKQFALIVGNVVKGIAGMAEAFGPLTRSMGSGLVGLARDFARWGDSLSKSSGFHAFIAYVKENGPILLDVLGKLVQLIVHLATALAPLGSFMLKALDAIVTFLDKLSPTQLLLLVGAVGALAGYFLGAGAGWIVAAVAAAGLIARYWKQIYPIIEPIIVGFRDGIAKAVEIVTNAIQSHRAQLSRLMNDLRPLLVVLRGVADAFGFLFKMLFEAIGYSWALTIDAISALTATFKPLQKAALAVAHWFAGPFVHFFEQAWSDIKGAFSDAWHWVQHTWSVLWRGVKDYFVKPITDAWHAITNTWHGIESSFRDTWDWVRTTFRNLWNGAKTLILTPINAARDGISNAWHGITSAFRDTWSWVRSTFSGLWHNVVDILTTPIHAAQRTFTDVWGAIKRGARGFVSGMRDIWSGLENIFKAPIKFLVQYVLNDGLIKAWDFIADHVPGMSSLHLNAFQPKWLGFADGGIYPGWTPGRDIGLIGVSGGESIMRPEWTRAVGPDYVHAANAAARAGGEAGVRSFLGGFASGGVVPTPVGGPLSGGLGSVLGGLLSGGAGLLNDLNPMHWLNWLKDKFTDVLHLMDRFSSTTVGKIIAGVPAGMAKGMVSAAWDDLKSMFSGPTVGGHGRVNMPKYHTDLIKQALAAAYAPVTADALDAVNIIVSNESGWNPTAVNKSDSNWLAGHPSVGLAQVIASTFASWVPKALRGVGPFAYGVSENPLANIAAGIRYAIGTYGSLDSVPGVYAVRHGQPYVGYDQGGWLPPGAGHYFNGTGKPEAVFTNQQAQQLAALAAGNGGGPAAFEGNLYLDSGEFLGYVHGAANRVIDKRVGGAQHAVSQNVPGGVLGALASPHARVASS